MNTSDNGEILQSEVSTPLQVYSKVSMHFFSNIDGASVNLSFFIFYLLSQISPGCLSIHEETRRSMVVPLEGS